jgi:hypothetical protein
VINFGRARFAAQEVPPDKAFRQLAADDHDDVMTSRAVLVMRMFE